jgi:hypothetical protein
LQTEDIESFDNSRVVDGFAGRGEWSSGEPAMNVTTKASSAARTSLMYITVGALINVWTIIYWIYLNRHSDGHTDAAFYWVYGFFFSGVVLLVIGLALGRIGRAARHAELPPELPNENLAEAPPAAATPAAPVGVAYAPNQYYPATSQAPAAAQASGMPAATVVTSQTKSRV